MSVSNFKNLERKGTIDMQGQFDLLKTAVDYPKYEKPALIVKHFLLESSITILSSDPNGDGTNPGGDNFVTAPDNWWD